MQKKRLSILNMSLMAMFIALSFVLPFITGSNRTLGNALCLMHIPVMLCGFLLGPYYGLIVGIISPLLRSFTLGMPKLMPSAVCMAIELGMYGLFCGLFFKALSKKLTIVPSCIISLIISMLLGRVIWGASRYVCGMILGEPFTLELFLVNGFATSWPGIILQLFLIPPLVLAVIKSKIIQIKNK